MKRIVWMSIFVYTDKLANTNERRIKNGCITDITDY